MWYIHTLMQCKTHAEGTKQTPKITNTFIFLQGPLASVLVLYHQLWDWNNLFLALGVKRRKLCYGLMISFPFERIKNLLNFSINAKFFSAFISFTKSMSKLALLGSGSIHSCNLLIYWCAPNATVSQIPTVFFGKLFRALSPCVLPKSISKYLSVYRMNCFVKLILPSLRILIAVSLFKLYHRY